MHPDAEIELQSISALLRVHIFFMDVYVGLWCSQYASWHLTTQHLHFASYCTAAESFSVSKMLVERADNAVHHVINSSILIDPMQHNG